MAPETNGTSIKVPWMSIIVAVVIALAGLSSWAVRLESTKADKTEVAEMKAEIRHSLDVIQSDVKLLLQRR